MRKMVRRWLRRRDTARELQLRSLAAMGYEPTRNMALMLGNQRARRYPLVIEARKVTNRVLRMP